MREVAQDVIRKTYPSGKRYLDFPETKGCQWDLNTFTRQMAGMGSWEMAKRFGLLLIKTFVTKDKTQNEKGFRNFDIYVSILLRSNLHFDRRERGKRKRC